MLYSIKILIHNGYDIIKNDYLCGSFTNFNSPKMNKNQAFNYMITLFKEWHLEVTKDASAYKEVFSKLSLLKLLFLTAATPNEEGDDLLDIFSNFYALPYGPVESDIYNDIKSNNLQNYTITDRLLDEKDNPNTDFSISDEDQIRIQKSVDALKLKNIHLVTLSAFELVEITHKWESWNKAFSFAQFMGLQSYDMSTDSIKNDRNKYYGN